MDQPQDDFSKHMIEKQYATCSNSTKGKKEYLVKMATLLSLRSIVQNTVDVEVALLNADGFNDVLYVNTTDSSRTIYVINLCSEEIPEEFSTSEEKNYFVKYFQNVKFRNTLTSKLEQAKVVNNSNIYILLSPSVNVSKCEFLVETSESNLAFLNRAGILFDKTYKFNFKRFPNRLDLSVNVNCENVRFLTSKIQVEQINQLILEEVDKIVEALNLKQTNKEFVAKNIMEFMLNLEKCNLTRSLYFSKRELLLKLSELLLSQYEVDLSQKPYVYYDCPKKNIWNDIVGEKRITLVDSSSSKTIVQFLIEYIGSEVRKHCRISADSWSYSFSEKEDDFFFQKYEGDFKKNNGKTTLLDIYKCLWLDGKLPLLLNVTKTEDYHNILRILELSNFYYKVILINNTKNETVFPKHKTINNTFCNLLDLNQDHRNKILKQTLKFQSRSSAILQNLLDENMLQYLNCSDIINILLDNFNIGNTFELPEHFMVPSFSKIILKANVLEELDDEFFVIEKNSHFENFFPRQNSFCKLDDVDLSSLSNCRIITMGKSYNQEKYEKLKSLGKPVHRLSIYDNNHLEWKCSFGSMEKLKAFRVHIENAFDSNISRLFLNPMNVVCATQGEGKSSFMDYVALSTPTNKWVLRISQNECANLLDEAEYYETSKVLKYYYRKNKKFTKLDVAIFEKLVNSKNILVLLDGFKESFVRCPNEVTDVSKLLHNEGFDVWLTTTPLLESQTEEELNTFSFRLKPFTTEDQERFLSKYFFGLAANLHQPPERVIIEQFVQKLLEASKRYLNDQNNEFIDIPLVTKLLADVFANQFNGKDNINFNKNFDLLYLYQSYTEQKISLMLSQFKEEERIKVREHQSLFALQLAFPEINDIVETNIFQEASDYYKSKPEKLKLWQKNAVIKVDENLTITCEHSTLAQYLTAQWLAANINSKDKNLKEVAQNLVKQRFSRNYKFLFGLFDRLLTKNNPLHFAVVNTQIEESKKIISAVPESVHQVDEGGRTILHIIALYSLQFSLPYQQYSKFQMEQFNSDCMFNLVEQIQLDEIILKVDSLGYNPLDYALANCSLTFANKLCMKSKNSTINAHISLNWRNDYFRYCSDLKYEPLMNFLLPYFASRDLLLNNVSKNTTIQDYLGDFEKLNKINLLQLLQSSDGVMYSIYVSKYYLLPYYGDLRYAVTFGSTRNLQKLLSEKGEINKQDLDKCTPLHYAALHGKSKCVDLLISKGALVNRRNSDGDTPLHLAVSMSNETIIKSLLSKGAKVDIANTKGETVLHLAIQKRTSILDKILFKTPFYLRAMKLLLCSGANINATNKKGETPLHLAVAEGYEDVLNELLLNGANINKQDCNGNTPLHLALLKTSLNNYVRLADLLATYGANVNLKNRNGDTAFHLASVTPSTTGVVLMVIKRANVNSKNRDGNTPLHLAVKAGVLDTVKLLITHGGSVNTQNRIGETPLQLATMEDNEDIVKLLISGA